MQDFIFPVIDIPFITCLKRYEWRLELRSSFLYRFCELGPNSWSNALFKELKNRWRKKSSEKLGKCSPFTTSLSMFEGLSLKLKCFHFLLQMHAVKLLNESLKALDGWIGVQI